MKCCDKFDFSYSPGDEDMVMKRILSRGVKREDITNLCIRILPRTVENSRCQVLVTWDIPDSPIGKFEVAAKNSVGFQEKEDKTTTE